MATLLLDGQVAEFTEGETILQVARRLAIPIPTLCYREGCSPETSCMVCVVRVEGSKRLVPACATPAAEGMVIDSCAAPVQAARRQALELLLGDHGGDCVGPCHSLCPAYLDIPAMLTAVAVGQWEQAVALVHEAIPLPATVGRLCHAPCEKGCRRGDLDQPVSIRQIVGAVGDHALRQGLGSSLRADSDRAAHKVLSTGCNSELTGRRPGGPTGARVAIVGAGPAGLTAACYLTRLGYRCTIYDDQPRPGGALQHGPDKALLPRPLLRAEVTALLATGIELRPNQRLGRELSLTGLRAAYQAVIIACGELNATQADEIGLPWAGHGLSVDAQSLATPLPGVYAAGAAVTPRRQVVRAVNSGHQVALTVAAALAARPLTTWGRPFSVHRGRLTPDELAAFAATADPAPRTPPPTTPGAACEPSAAQAEARRCLHCECEGREQCQLRNWAMATGANPAAYRALRHPYRRETSHPNLLYEPGKCIVCGLCVQIAAAWAEPLGLTFVDRGFTVQVSTPWGEPLSRALTTAARACAEACPTRALIWRNDAPPTHLSQP